jgi:dipeptidyl-peptidase-4
MYNLRPFTAAANAKLTAAALAAACLLPSPAFPQFPQFPDLAPKPLPDFRSLPDGNSYTATDDQRTMIVRFSYSSGLPLDTLFNTASARQCDFQTFDDYRISPASNRIIIFRNTQPIYRHSKRFQAFDFDIRRNFIKPLSDSGQPISCLAFSPNGRMCTYVIDNNLFIKKFDFDTELQITRDGLPGAISNANTPWVYEEEFGITALAAWSPDSEHFAFVRFDESDVPLYSLPIYSPSPYPSAHHYRYPTPGQPNPKLSLFIYDVRERNLRTLDPPIDPQDYIPRIDFALADNRLLVFALNRLQNTFSLFAANPKSGVFQLLLRESDNAYIDPDHLASLHLTYTGFLHLSERDGFTHIYQHSHTGELIRQLTSGHWDVTHLYGLSPTNGFVYFQAAYTDPLRRDIFSVDPKGSISRLTSPPGTNTAAFSNSFKFFLNTFSAAHIPPITAIHDASGKMLRLIEDNAHLIPKLNALPKKTFTSILAHDSIPLNAWIIFPPHLDSTKLYPLLLTQYSGPNSQKVLDRFETPAWEYELALSHGFIVACVDPRGTGARGHAFRKAGYLRLGIPQTRDLTHAAKALAQLPFVDPSRIAIHGWSFGGYTALMALTFGDGIFAAAIAGAPPVDWRFYDSIYTERFLRTPQENPQGYSESSPLLHVDKLQGRLLLIHGTADDNVHLSQTLDYVDQLTLANKAFRLHLYKDRTHSLRPFHTLDQSLPSVKSHLHSLMTDFLLGIN